MKLLKSNKFELPKVVFVTEREKIKDIPKGVPYVYGDPEIEEYLVRLMEYEIIYKSLVKSGLPFNFREVLIEKGYTDIETFDFSTPAFFDVKQSDEHYEDVVIADHKGSTCAHNLREFARDCSAYVDMDKLKELDFVVTWYVEHFEEALALNIHRYAVTDYNLYNKKTDMCSGGVTFVDPQRNAIICDISSSIPKSCSYTILVFVKTLAENLYADVIITGSKTTVYPYENLHLFDVKNAYKENGMDNDQQWFKQIISERKSYGTVVVFGDHHTFRQNWSNEYNKDTKKISLEDGKKLCQWDVKKLISFHTKNSDEVAGYGDCFTPTEGTVYVKDWVKYLKR